MYCETYIKIKELKNKMTKEQMQVSKEELEKWNMEQTKLAMQVPKEELEKIKMEQIKLEMQRPEYIDAKVPEGIKGLDELLKIVKETLKDYSDRVIGYSQEWEGTFKIKDGKVTDIDIKGIALIPRFRDKDEEVE